MIEYLAVIQARLGSTRLPGKVLMTVGGVPIVKRVWLAAKKSWADKVVVAWPERYPDLDENNVLERFRRISNEFPSPFIIRLTADCPLLKSQDINSAIQVFRNSGRDYYSNYKDGNDVQIFSRTYLFSNFNTHKEHVIADFSTPRTGLSVNTIEDLQRVRKLCATK